MKTKSLIIFMILPVFFSCKNHVSETVEGEVGTGTSPDVVVLSGQQQDALGLKLGTFMMRNLTTVIKINGQLDVAPSGRASVPAIVGGNVEAIRVFEGDRVRRGQVLAVLIHPDYITLQENFAEAANKLDFLEKEYERQKALFDNNVGAGKDFQLAGSEYKTARVRYEGLKARLELLHISAENVLAGKISDSVSILAPINGYVSEAGISLGAYADAKDVLFRITDLSSLHADFLVYEKDVPHLRVGQKIHFRVTGYSDEELPATIFAIGKEFDEGTRAVHIHARLDRNPGNLIPGAYISGHIHTDDQYTRTLPNDAIVKEGTRWFIFVADEPAPDGAKQPDKSRGALAFHMVEVIAGREDEGYTEIRLPAPLTDTTQIVMNAAYYLLADMKKGETGEE